MLALSHQFEIGMATMFVAAASYSLAAESDITVPPETRPFMLAMPPTYPEEARAQRITGRGLYDVFIDPPTGVVTRVTVTQSTGSKILDGAAVNAFLRWCARPGKLSHLRAPMYFYASQVMSPKASNRAMQQRTELQRGALSG